MNLKPKNKLELALATAVSAWFIAVVACTAPVSSPAISEAVEEALKAFLEHPLLVLDDRLKDLEHKELPTTQVKKVQQQNYSQQDYNCLTEGLYWEIRSGDERAMRNVADVIVNRAQHDKFPQGICATIKQYRQFSYRNSGAPRNDWMLRVQESEQKALDKVKEVAENTLKHGSTNKELLWYHTSELKPKPAWTKSLNVAAKDGYHIFYKEN